ncbi:hypothetical protein GCM10009764_13410 [Nocardia ninae]|uniref:Uncharacterized protein n=1 Tax=Nocardia ninae NBRC 108245 TaxID=1210091 RepID=A0A511MR83_9NOCA|nr:hypothetical protein NN4_75980 [Nocardia ninae NBRC 108245]
MTPGRPVRYLSTAAIRLLISQSKPARHALVCASGAAAALGSTLGALGMRIAAAARTQADAATRGTVRVAGEG